MSLLLHSKRSLPRQCLTSSSRIPAAAIFLQVPLSYHASHAFHASPRPQFLESAITTCHGLLEGVHSLTSLPWLYSIPLSALIVRITFILPTSIYSRRVMQQQFALQPLLWAWRHHYRKETIRESVHLGPKKATVIVSRKLSKKATELFKRWNCQRWKIIFPPLAQFPIWLLMVETIRRMCGTHIGLLGLLSASIRGETEETRSLAPDENTPLVVGLEESFATEGGLWFPSLLLPDPQMLLPFMLSGVMFLNLSRPKGSASSGVWAIRLERSLKIVALAIGPLTLHMPSAMLVYWISSSTLAIAQGLILNHFMPVKAPVTPCKSKWERLSDRAIDK